MVRDVTHGSCLQPIAFRLLSITPHFVMPERRFSVLDWQHSKQRNRLSPFTLDATAKIHTYCKDNSCDSQIDNSLIDETLGDDIHSDNDLTEHTNADETVT
jgi:hypothetical protein